MGLFKTAHKFYREFFNSDGTFKNYEDIINGKNSFYVFSKEQDINDIRLIYIEKLYKAILKDIEGNQLAIDYIKNESSVRETVNSYIEHCEPDLNADTARSKIIKASGKINRQFKFIYEYKNNGKTYKYDTLETLIRIKCHKEEEYLPILKECYKEIDDYCKNSADTTVIKREIVGIKLNSTAKMTEKPSTEEFENFIEMIRPYTKNTVSVVQELINNNENSVAYFNYLVDPTRPKDNSEKELSNDLRRMLGLEELYITSIDKIF